jgi:hypothetical protein
MCVYSVFVLFYVLVASLRRADPLSKESYRVCIGKGKVIPVQAVEALRVARG